MNQFILTVQGYLLYPENYTKEQLEENYRAVVRDTDYAAFAWAAYDVAAVAAAWAAYDAAAYYAARGAALAAALDAEYWLSEYFDATGESRQDYIDAINEGK